MTLDQAVALLGVVGVHSQHRLAAYLVLSLLTGVRTEEARALHWAEVGLEAGTVPCRICGRASRFRLPFR